MPVPWEALIPFGASRFAVFHAFHSEHLLGLLTVMFTAGGSLHRLTSGLQNEGKPPRYNMDGWDRMMMERDRRLTGHKRGQKSTVEAPTSFSTNSAWPAKTTHLSES
ncbi:hypothetical protein DL96DRAFT_1014213 [Flagelloscypha sp. PMI_526]|nr:hypothetical protein DL96DRAFT_1014213 [Flagelloscypha sp. PMI_526]